MKQFTFYCTLTLSLFASLWAAAQIQISFPTSRAVFQRNTANSAAMSITGTYSVAITRIDARVEAINGQGTTMDWQTIVANPQGGIFAGTLTAQGGWYRLSVRLMRDNQQLAIQTVDRVGVGEVFVIAGQSNAQGIRTDTEAAQDDRVSCVDYFYDPTQYPNDAPMPEFTHLDGAKNIAPRGVGSWCWGRLGDLLTARLNVPVLFFNASFSGTSVRTWAETAVGERTLSDYYPEYYQPKHPYFPLKLALQNYTNRLGVRAVLWHQGEADNEFKTTTAQYVDRLQTVIRQSRADFGQNVSWVVARASFSDKYQASQQVIDAQNQVVANGSSVFAGPNTDVIQIPRSRSPLYDIVHFDNAGLRDVAAAWDANLTAAFFNNAAPISPAAAPAITVNCAGNNSVTYTVTNYQQVFWESGETGRSVTKPAGSTIRAKVKDALGNVHYTPLITLSAAPTISADGPTRFCETGRVNLTSSTDQNFAWNNGATTKTISVTSTGTYSVSVRDGSGCSFTSNTIPVSINPLPAAPTITVQGSLTSCLGDNATLLASPAASYQWSNGQTSQSIALSQSGSYSLTVADENGCRSPASSVVAATVNPRPDAPTLSYTGRTVFCANESLTLNANTQPNYEWSNGLTSQSVVIRQSGNYSVRTRNSFNCPSLPSNVVPVTVNPLPDTPVVSSTQPTTFCQGNSIVLNVSTVGANYNWNTGDRTSRLTVSQSGSFSLTVSDGNGCVSAPSNVVNVVVNPVPTLPQLTASGRTLFCANESVTLTSTPETAYEWSNGQTSRSIVVNQSGRYFVRTRNMYNCFSDRSGAINVTVNPLPNTPTITSTQPTTFCQGASTVLVASPAASYQWSNGDQSQRVSVTQSGSFSLTVSDANGCVSLPSAVVTVMANPLPETPRITASGSTTFCADGSVTLSSTAEASYVWNTGQTTRSIGINQSGTYSLRTRNAFNCQSAESNVLTVLVNPLPAPPVLSARGSLTFCEGTQVIFQTSSPLRTIWSTGDSTQTLAVLQAGSYTARVRDANGCLSPSSQPLVATTRQRPSAPQLNRVGTYVLEASGAPENERYYWRRDADSLTISTASLRVSQSGVYSVRTATTYAPTLVCLSAPSAGYTYSLPTDNQNISLYPNPSPDGIFQLESLLDLSNTTILVYTLAGQQVYQTTAALIDGRRQIDLSMLLPGPYIVAIQSGTARVSKRVQIKQ